MGANWANVADQAITHSLCFFFCDLCFFSLLCCKFRSKSCWLLYSLPRFAKPLRSWLSPVRETPWHLSWTFPLRSLLQFPMVIFPDWAIETIECRFAWNVPSALAGNAANASRHQVVRTHSSYIVAWISLPARTPYTSMTPWSDVTEHIFFLLCT